MQLTRRIITLLLALVMVLSVSATVFADESDTTSESHNYVNGFCTDCDAYEPATMVTEENYAALGLRSRHVGYYAIGNAGQLYWFAQRSVEYPKDNAVLAKNITVNSGTVNASSVGLREWTPIAGCNNYFHGIFDGNGKTISGLYYNRSVFEGYYVGLVSILGKTGVVKNVTISNSYLEAFWHIGAIAGHNDGLISNCGNNSTTIKSERNAGGITGVNMGTVELCGNSGNITVKDQCAGGIIGCHMEGTVRSCWNTGTVKAGQYAAGGIAGFVGNPEAKKPAPVENCWSTGKVTCDGGKTAGGLIGKGMGSLTVRNCYTTMDVAIGEKETTGGTPNISKVETKTRDQFTSGEVAYLLQKDLTTPIWGQNLDNGKPVQTVPLFSTATVYQIKLDDKGAVGYSNDPNADPNDFASATQPEETKPEETNPEETTSKNTKPEASKPEDQAAVDTQSPADGTGSAGIYILISILGLLAVAAAVLLVIKFRRKSAG